MGAKAVRNQKPRSPRLQSHHGEFSNFVRYGAKGEDTIGTAAQFADVSATGMRLISRHPTSAGVGDPLLVEFTIPGENRKIKSHARIVRKTNDYIIAVHFLNMKENESIGLQAAIARCLNSAKWEFVTKPARRLKVWTDSHKQGLVISLLTTLVFGATIAFIVLGSDWFQNRTPQPWGKSYPRQWDWDYYNKIKPSK